MILKRPFEPLLRSVFQVARESESGSQTMGPGNQLWLLLEGTYPGWYKETPLPMRVVAEGL